MDSTTLWIACFLPLFIILLVEHQCRQAEGQRHALRIIQRKRKKEGRKPMNETLQRYVGKECIITTNLGSAFTGSVEAIEDNWLILCDGDMVNIDYVSRIREHPRNKKGKKKAVITS